MGLRSDQGGADQEALDSVERVQGVALFELPLGFARRVVFRWKELGVHLARRRVDEDVDWIVFHDFTSI